MSKELDRRDFLKKLAVTTAGTGLFGGCNFAQPVSEYQEPLPQEPERIIAKEFTKLPSLEYRNVSHTKPDWKPISDGMDFSRIEVHKDNELVDIIATVRINPDKNDLTLYNGFNFDLYKVFTANIETWQEIFKETVMINGAQYQAGDYYYRSCALAMGNQVIYEPSEDKIHTKYSRALGPKKNKAVRGMIVGQPTDKALPNIDLLDFKYDTFDYNTSPYTHGVQHWMMLLDREGKVRVGATDWQANRTVVAKDKDKNMLFMTTEGGYFTLFNFGRFLQDSNARPDGGFNIHTAMNMDGGYEADMAVLSDKIDYLTYGEFETYGPDRNATVFGAKIELPGVLGVSPKK